MQETLMMQAALAVPTIRPFLSSMQLSVMGDLSRGEEGSFFLQKFIDLQSQISTMPKTWDQDGKGDAAIAYLHYFIGGCDWYITEKDMDGGVQQAFGYAILNGDDECAELGYISITEITRCGAELDLHFTPCTLAEIKAKRAAQNAPEIEFDQDAAPWVVVTNAGTDDEAVWANCETLAGAIKQCDEAGGRDNGFDVMKRLDDGTLTTEF